MTRGAKPMERSVETAKRSIERRDNRYWNYLAQTGQLAGNADKTWYFVHGLALAIENKDV